MDTEKLGRSRFLNLLFRFGGFTMESRARRWLFDPRRTLRGADLTPGQTVFEIGCGTGFFTLPAAEMIGECGHLIAMDPLSDFVDKVNRKVSDAGFENVEVIRRDALKSGLEAASVDVALAFGVLPFPTLPLNKLLPELHRVLTPGGTLAVWLFPVAGYVPGTILKSGLFSDLGKKNGVFRYRPIDGD